MTNKTLKFSIFPFIFAFGIMYFYTNNEEDKPPYKAHETEEILKKSNNDVQIITDIYKLNTSNNNGVKNASINGNSTDTTLESKKQPESIQQNQFFNKEGTLNINKINDALTLKDSEFFDLMNNLSNDTNETAIIRQQNLANTLLSIENLNQYNYEQACGNGICAIKVPFIDKNTLKELGNEITTKIKTGVFFSRHLINEYGGSELRMIFDANPESKGELVLSPGTQLGIE